MSSYEINNIYYNADGYYHRLDGPVVDFHNVKLYYIYGYYHRLDGPAIEWTNGIKSWYIYGERISNINNLIINLINTNALFI